MPDNLELIRRRHPEWQEHQRRWRWLLDSLEGGDRYRQAIYGYDSRGLPIRNLVRHKREYPEPRDPSTSRGGVLPFKSNGPIGEPDDLSTDDDYELRRTRTPVPTFVAEAVEAHLSRIFAREVRRDGPECLRRWWSDIDGCGSSIDHWMAETVAPILLTLGQVDLYFDHPRAPGGEEIATRADAVRLGLDRCLTSVILPEDLLWWRLDATGNRYDECLVMERHEEDDGRETVRYRHWTEAESTLYTAEGEVVEVVPHPFGRVPIVRVFDRRKPRCRNIGQSRYEGIAERQREYYNRDSELILSDTTQAHPLLQGPEDYLQADGTIPIGPSWLLPKKKNNQGGVASYEGFDVITFPKEGADSIRLNKSDLRDDVDRDSALVRPAAAQSGVAKMLDHLDGNLKLAKVAKVLARAEQAAAELALLVLCDGQVDRDATVEVTIVYPADFDLFTAGDVAGATSQFQSLVARAGALPTTETLMLGRLVRLCLPGMSDPQYLHCEREIADYVQEQWRRRAAHPEDLGSPGTEQTIYADVRKWQET